ncbi:MAG: DUF3887 domain-containing protein [Spirochaetia bacterium]
MQKPVSPEDREQIINYMDPITNTVLEGFTENDYNKYTKFFDEQMKNAMPESVFKQTRDLIISKIGNHESHELWDILREDQYIIMLYSGKFEKEDDVTIKIVFQEYLNSPLVSGLWFDSPKLRS